MTDKDPAMDHSSHESFKEYYTEQSQSDSTRAHFLRLRDVLLRVCQPSPGQRLKVVDVGGGAGTAAMLWAEAGHDACCLDINEEMITLGRQRAQQAGLDVRFELGSATQLPLEDACADVCMVPQLLEHVPEWELCLDECARVLRPGGLLFLSTTNKVCPRQNEFNLPLYAWYPGRLKRHYETLARTTRPELANYATYPAVNWFTFRHLSEALRARGFDSFLDRFDLIHDPASNPLKSAAVRASRLPGMRSLSQLFVSSTKIAAFKAG